MHRSAPVRSLLATLAALTFTFTACTDEPVGPDDPLQPHARRAVSSADADIEGSFAHTPGDPVLVKRHPDAVCTLDGGLVVIEGSIDLNALGSSGAVMIGLIDQGLYDTYGATTDTWASGAYAFFGDQGTLRVGPSDGRDVAGEFIQGGVNVAMPTLPATLDFTLTVDPGTGKVIVTYDGADYPDDYGLTEAYFGDAYTHDEFANGAIIGVDLWDAAVAYRLQFVSGCLISDEEAPVVTDVTATPNPVSTTGPFDLTAHVDDTNTGGSDIASAEYTLDGGTTWASMMAVDGTFDDVSEDVTATVTHDLEPGLHAVCVRGTDDQGNQSAPECTQVVVYDPSGGFVTGGGWFTASGGYDEPGGAIVVDINPSDDWGFNLEPPYVTPAGFSGAESSIGSGSIHVEPITNAGGDEAKFALQYNPEEQIPLDAFDGFSIDFLIDDGTTLDADQFYVNVYTLTPDPDDGTWYDCRFDYVASTGSASTWMSLSLDGSTVKDGNGGDKIGGCPATLDGMPAGSTIFRITVNLGDTTPNDAGVGGYFDNAVLTVDAQDTTWDFEEPVYTGKATFGFVSKYKKGASTPTGNTQFQFKTADLDFHSTSYDWLVVNQGGENAQFKGEGTINGTGPYKFMLWAGDHDSGDTFRIRITETDGDVVYDNGVDQAIEGGNIIVHDGKGGGGT